MAYGAIDLHKKESQIRMVTEAGEVVDRRISTRRESFTAVFGTQPRMRILLEASTESEWVACDLEELGHEVIVADPNYAAMYGGRSRRIKTDLRDVAAWTLACGQGTYRAIHRRSPARRIVQGDLQVRETLVQMRSALISMVRAMTRAEGLRIPSGTTDSFVPRLDRVALSPSLAATLEPLRRLLACLTEQIDRADTQLAARATQDPTIALLTTFPTIGAVTASAFVAAIDDVTRFARGSSRQLFRPRAVGVQLRRTSTARPRSAQCTSARASVAGASGVAGVAVETTGDRRAARVGRTGGAPARQAHRGRGPRPTHRPHVVCDVAG